MSKRGYISRYLLIIKKLKAKPYSSYEELRDYIKNQLEFFQMLDDGLNIGFSKRTLQRDLREIRNVFGIDIEYSKPEQGYYIIQTQSENLNFQRMIESFDIFTSLNIAHDLSQYIHLENHKPQGTEKLYGLIHAIKNCFMIKFSYHKFWDEKPSIRTVVPYGIKEFKNRWYVIANDNKDNRIKSFALDRLSELEITGKTFMYPKEYDIEEVFSYCFGIINPDGIVPQEIILSFEPFQGKYVKTLPLHHTQEILVDTNKEFRIKLKLCVTVDLIMELMSFGSNLKVIEPKSLVDQIKDGHRKAYKLYR